MPQNRRDFLKAAGMLGTTLALSPSGTLAAERSPPSSRRILILGGTGFIGPHMVRYAVERGHAVSIFTRGRSRLDVAGVEQLIGDRNDDHDALRGRSWDVVIDNNASRDYRWVQRSTKILRDAVDHYIFISSISAYRIAPELSRPDRVIETPVVDANHARLGKPASWSEGEPLEYGPMKAYCEDIVHAALPGRATVVRPGLIVGPGDPTDRFTYWPTRISEGGEVLAPGNPRHANQIIDQRDLTEWVVRLAEQRTTGNFNGVGPASRMSMAEMLYGIRAAFSAPVKFTWVSTGFLTEKEVAPWQDLPSWIPGDPLMFADNAPAIASGLTFRPLAVTAADTAAWDRSRPEAMRSTRPDARFGLSRQREKTLLAAWHQRGQ